MNQAGYRHIFGKLHGSVAVWCAVILCLSAAFGQEKKNNFTYQPIQTLSRNARVERPIKKDEVHLYTLQLKRGELIYIKAEQRGINIALAIAKDDAERKLLKQINDAPTADGTEKLVFMAETDGEYIFGVFGFGDGAAESKYILQTDAAFSSVEEKLAAAIELDADGSAASENKDYNLAVLYHQTALDLLKDAPATVETASITFNLGNDFFNAGKYLQAIDFYRKAIPIYRKFDQTASEAFGLFNIGGALQNLKDYEKSNLAYEQALPVLIKAGDESSRAKALTNIGDNYRNLKEHEKAGDYYEQALLVFQKSGDKSNEGSILFNIAGSYFNRSEYEKALEYYQRAVPVYRQLKDRENEAALLSNIGLIYARLNKESEAFDYLDQTFKVLADIKNPALEAKTYSILGDIYIETGRSSDALKQYEQSLKSSREGKDRLLETAALRGIGLSYSELGNYETALKYHQDALEIAVALNDETEQSIQFTNLALAYMELGKYERAFEYNRKSLEIDRRNKDKYGERTVLNNIGVAYLRLGSLSKAEEYIQQSAEINRQLKDRRRIAIAVSNLGTVYTRLKQYEKAIAHFEEALPLLKEFKNYRFLVTTNYYYGTVRRERGELDKAVALHKEAIEIARAAHTPKFEARAQIELGLDFLAQNKIELAAVNFQEALIIAREVKAREEESAALDGLMQSHRRLGQKTLAIFYGKQSINLLQAIRSEIVKFDKDIQSNYVKDNEQTYRQLAETLISEGRLPEAQQVLAMLKEEELSGFVRRDVKEIENLSKRADLRANEKAALEKYNQISSKVTSLGAELTALEDKKRMLAAGKIFAEQARLDELNAQIKIANTAFRLFLEKELAAELKESAKAEIAADRALQGKLQQWGKGVVALATIVGADRYRVILTTAKTQTDGKTEITAADLNAKIFAFREALLNPTIDPKPLGKELYDILIKPIEKDLDAAGAKTLLWSLDGTLRYIPMAALWDGKQYLLQKYQNVILTSTTRQSLQAEVDKDWRVLGAGVTKASEITDANTAQKFSFDELKSVAKELAAIIGDGGKSAKNNFTPGVGLLDNAFTEDALKEELKPTATNRRKYNVVHFATHFHLGSDTADSFLLLGNNKALTLADVADSPEINLTDVELVTLSACNTGFNALNNSKILTENNGKEVDSLASFIETRGAKSVVATLWSVADESTALLMGEFYRLRKNNTDLSKAETLRRAQLEMLDGKYTPEQIAERNRSEAVRFGASAKNMPKFIKDENAPFAHPFYWSPFVLIGNWR
jgi:CHAT domain-containing protein/Tfp pilus assembly protein PilF